MRRLINCPFVLDFIRKRKVMSLLENIGPVQIGYSLVVLIIAILSRQLIERFLVKTLRKRARGKRVILPLKKLLSIIIYTIALMLILATFEVDLTSILATLGIGAIIIGIGLQDIVENWVSGIIIILEGLYSIDDVVQVDGTTGRVRNITLRSTILETYDKNNVIIPNSNMIKNKVINFTSASNQCIVSVFSKIDYTQDLEKAKKIISDVLRKDPNVLFDEERGREIRFVITVDSWDVGIETLFWINSPKDEIFIKSRITQDIKEEFDEEGILPPLPGFLRRDHMKIRKSRKRK